MFPQLLLFLGGLTGGKMDETEFPMKPEGELNEQLKKIKDKNKRRILFELITGGPDRRDT